jgi:nucleoside-diphosphate-sugar epimerase
MNVLVTGGAGFLGGYVMAALRDAGHECYAYDVATPSPEMQSAVPWLTERLRLGSIGDLEGLLEICRADRIEAIVHAAARVGMNPSLADPLGFYQTNVMGLVNACEAARRLALRKLILISSNAAYHGGRGTKLVETDPSFSITHANPAAHYGTSKMACEAIGIAYAEFHDVDFIALRVTAIYGFGMNSPVLIKPMVENAVAGKPTRLSSGARMKRDYTHVLDCCRAIVLAMNAPPMEKRSQRVINVAAGRIFTGAELADIVRRVIPSADIEIGDALTPLEEANVKMRAPLDIAMANRLLKWSPRWSIEDGVREYADRFDRYLQSRY